jgi:hypothetical protein
MNGKLLSACLIFAVVGVTMPASATVITVTMTGQMFGGEDNDGFFNGGIRNGPFTGQPFTLTYTFDTSLAAVGNYINTGSSSSLSGSSCVGCSSTVVGYVTGTFGIFPGNYENDFFNFNANSSESDSATIGNTSQNIYDNSGIYHGPFGSLSTSISNSVIPGDITALACTRFRRHRVRCFDGTGGESWRGGSLHRSSSLRQCG